MGIKQAASRTALNTAIDYIFDDPEKRISQLVSLVNKLAPDNLFPSQRAAITRSVEEKNNWYEFILRLTQLEPAYGKRLLKTLIVDANMEAWPVQQTNREQYECNIPWAILLDPTTACNLNCTGCWAADYGNALSLTYDEINSIVEQGKALGTHIFIYTGGEPLTRKQDLIRLCEEHPDCAFLCFTNGTLIDEAFCDEMLRVANFVPAISVEGFEEATDARRGQGTFARVVRAMDLMRARGLAFGTSCCFTSANASSIASEEFFDWQIEQGALFSWIFTYMPIGKSAPTDLMATPEQREYLYHFGRKMREEKPFFVMDFWNDGEFVGGCIAGGRRYLHINAAGDLEPCVFAHYSTANIRETSLLEALQTGIFKEYYLGQPFNDNLLRPCPMLDNSGALAEMVERCGASATDLQDAESAKELCDKCQPAIDGWAPVAHRIWNDEADPRYPFRQNERVGLDELDFRKLEKLGRR